MIAVSYFVTTFTSALFFGCFPLAPATSSRPPPRPIFGSPFRSDWRLRPFRPLSLRGGAPRPSSSPYEVPFPSSTSLSSLLDVLDVDPSHGLSSTAARSRLIACGANVLPPQPRTSLLRLFLQQFDDRLVQILLLVAAVSGFLSIAEYDGASSVWRALAEPLVILTILLLNAVTGAAQASGAARSLAALVDMSGVQFMDDGAVLRDGDWERTGPVPPGSLVPGDVVRVRTGDRVPADCRILKIETSTLAADEGCLTGESVAAPKETLEMDGGEELPLAERENMVYGGTAITVGSAICVVVATGQKTEMGKIQKGVVAAREDEQKTPLGKKLDEFGNILTVIIGAICLAVWAISIPKFSDPSFLTPLDGALHYAKVAVALGVAAIPEGLPAVITLCLSLGTRRMAQRNVVVRRLPSVETLGCTSVICTDKTGTLTLNQMTVTRVVLVGKEGRKVELQERSVTGNSYSPIGTVEGLDALEADERPRGAVADLVRTAALCNDARVIGNDEDHSYTRSGEPTEAALCALVEKLGSGYSNTAPSVKAGAHVGEIRGKHMRTATLEFNRNRKSMGVLCRGISETGNRLYVKGAPNLLLERCTHVKLRDGSVVRLSGALRREVEDKVAEMAQRSLRCLAFAVKETNNLPQSLRKHGLDKKGDEEKMMKNPLLANADNFVQIESGLTLVGFVGIKDPARPEVKESIQKCSSAGIRIIMITGDARDTAVAIARDVNIFQEEDFGPGKTLKAFEGKDFFHLPQEQQLHLLQEGNMVFSRAEPSDKQKLVRMLQQLHEIPAMTGDGVNDAPALQQAAIGIAMGITGTEVAKEAADMILVDDNFSSIVAAVEEGRCIYANMQAFISFLISSNIGEIFSILLATLAGFPEPLTAMHLLWVNLVTDSFPATALGFNPPSPDVMQEKPRPSDEPIMSQWMFVRYCLTGTYVGIATVGIFVQHYILRGLSIQELRR
mmetsp:Transcript_28723/g.65643  ORF Transcript_28723/g.65643 Transcript_28723/m.65643 type:complete len:960 (-) Transcript_28723:832-3711(-)